MFFPWIHSIKNVQNFVACVSVTTTTDIGVGLLAGTSSAAEPPPAVPSNQPPLTIKSVVDAVRFALVGSPVYHAKQRWDFDPEVSLRRNPEYERLHGQRSAWLMERLGLGEDGREEERRHQQAVRDIGVPITGKR